MFYEHNDNGFLSSFTEMAKFEIAKKRIFTKF